MLRTLPGDDVRQIMWRFADRYDLQMLVQSARAVARGPVARLVADGAPQYARVDGGEGRAARRRSTSRASPTAYMDPEYGGFIEGPKNLALALVAFELAWVDAGAATGSLAQASRARADPRARHADQRDTTWAGRAAAAGRASRCARRVLPDRTDSVRRSRDRTARRQGAHRANGQTARSRCSRSTSAAGSSRTWASRTS